MGKIKTKKKLSKKAVAKKVSLLLAILIIIFSIPAIFFVYFLDRVYPGVYVSGINLSGKSKNEAAALLQQNTSSVSETGNIVLTYQDRKFEIPTSSLNPQYDFETSTERAIQLGQSVNIFINISRITNSIIRKTNYNLEFSVDTTSLDGQIESIGTQITKQSVPPTYQISENTIIVTPGTPG